MKNSPLKILIVDDEPLLRELLLEGLPEFLGEYDVRIVTCGNAEEAIPIFHRAKYLQNPFDVVITDNNMGKISGVKLAELIKCESQDTVVIIVTGAANEITDHLADEVLEKPVPMATIAKTITDLLSANAESSQGRRK